MTDHILVPRAVLQAAAECLNFYMSSYGFDSDSMVQIKKLRALLDAPCAPVGSLIIDKNRGTHVTAITSQPFDATCLPLYAPKEQL